MTSSVRAERRWWLATLAVIVLSVTLAGMRASQINLWSDEYHTLRVATLPLDRIVRGDYYGVHPPLYYLLVHVWAAPFDWAEPALRILSLAWGLVVFGLCFLIARELWASAAAGALVTSLVALHPFFLNYAVEIRSYMLVAALGLGALYCLLRFRRAQGRAAFAWAIAMGVLVCLGMYVHHFSILVPVSLCAVVLVDSRDRAGRRRGFLVLAVLALVGLAYIPGLLLLIRQSAIYLPQGQVNSIPLTAVLGIFKFSYHRPIYEPFFDLLGIAALLISLLGATRNAATQPTAAFFGLAIAGCFGLSLIAYTLGVALIPRYVIYLVALVFLSLGGLMTLRGRILQPLARGLAALLVVAYLVYGIDFTLHAGDENRLMDYLADWEQVSEQIGVLQQPDEPLVVTGWDSTPVQYYLGQPALNSGQLRRALEEGTYQSYLILQSSQSVPLPDVGQVMVLYADPAEGIQLLRLTP